MAKRNCPAKNKEADIENNRGKRQRGLNICLAVVSTVFCALIALAIYSQLADLHESREEMAILGEPTPMEATYAFAPKAMGASQQPHISEFDISMREINPDYVCWLKIDDTGISYPVVRGDDNEAYLGLNFHGEDNYLGSIFMDYRCTGGYVPNIIIFGHNSRQGDMFGGLRNFLDDEFLAEHPVITLIVNDKAIEYEICSVRRTDINDPAYFLDFDDTGAFDGFIERCGLPLGSAQILTLSTCVSGTDKDERVVIQGVLI